MHETNRLSHRRPLALAVVLGAAVSFACPPSRSAERSGPIAVGLAPNPGFRSDLGVHASFGGSSCLAGGSDYAACSGDEASWMTRFGFQAGVVFRPFPKFSFGLDLGYTTLKERAHTANRWRDLTVGPVLRFHIPIRVGQKLRLEPSFGLQSGFVHGVFRMNETDDSSSLALEHEHYGPFIAALVGLDFFPVPRVGLGFDIRVLRTFYTTVCFEDANGQICRGTSQDDLYDSDVYEGTSSSHFRSDQGVASYPWKIFWGVHALYYF